MQQPAIACPSHVPRNLHAEAWLDSIARPRDLDRALFAEGLHRYGPLHRHGCWPHLCALHLAAIAATLAPEKARWLLQAVLDCTPRAQVDLRDARGKTALRLAMESGGSAATASLLLDAGASADAFCFWPLLVANGKRPLEEWLQPNWLQKYPRLAACLDAAQPRQATPADDPADVRTSRRAAIGALLASASDRLHRGEPADRVGRECADDTRRLLDFGMSWDAQERAQGFPMWQHLHPQIWAALHDAGLPVQGRWQGKTFLHGMASQAILSKEGLDTVLRRRPDWLEAVDAQGHTPLDCAALAQDRMAIEVLDAAGAIWECAGRSAWQLLPPADVNPDLHAYARVAWMPRVLASRQASRLAQPARQEEARPRNRC